MHVALSAPERRVEVRMPVYEPVVLTTIVDGALEVSHGSLVDIGPGGAGIELSDAEGGPPRGAELVLVADGGRTRHAGRVVGRSGRTVHVAFAANVVDAAA
jgi:hypothetical protein